MRVHAFQPKTDSDVAVHKATAAHTLQIISQGPRAPSRLRNWGRGWSSGRRMPTTASGGVGRV